MSNDDEEKVHTDIAVIKEKIAVIASNVTALSDHMQKQISLMATQREFEFRVNRNEYRIEKLEKAKDGLLVWIALSFLSTIGALAMIVWKKVFG